MLKRLALLAIAAFVAVVPLTTQPNKTFGQEQQSTKQGQPSVITPSPEKHDGGGQDKGKASPNAPNWYASFENPDGMLVIVGLITCWVIGWQSMETRRAAKGAQRAADASFAQIELMKSKERARLVFAPQPLKEIEIDNGLGDMEIQIGNFGSTHAFNVRYGAWCEITKSEEEEMDEVLPSSAVGIIRANADPERVRVCIASRNCNEIKANARGLFVHLSGRVEYEDVFGDSHFIRFQYILQISRLKDPIIRDGLTILPVVDLGGWKKCSHREYNDEN